MTHSWSGFSYQSHTLVQRNLLAQPPGFFEENRPSEIASRLTADTAILEQVVGSSVSIDWRNWSTAFRPC